jgi:FAD/FMN-containing dehydrogenase
MLGAASALPLLALLRDRAWASAPVPNEIGAARLDGTTTTLSRGVVEDFRASLRGPLLLAADDGYDTARKVWNAAIDRRPALIARCVGATDIARSLQFAAAHNLLVAVRGGGHSTSGASVCDRGLMIDLSLMQGVRVAPDLTTVRAAPGVLLGAIDREALAANRVTTTGMVSHTGAAGLTLGGGCGRLARRFGLTADNLMSVDIVTPDGVLRPASAQDNPDLYWAVRGGSGNFGVVSTFEYRLHPFDPVVYGGTLQFAATHARAVLRHFAGFMAGAPEELWITTSIGDAESADDRTVTFEICYSGPLQKAEALLKPLRDFRKPVRADLGPVAYGRLQMDLDHEGRHGLGRYQTSGYLMKLDDALIDTALAHFEKPNPVPLRVMIMPWGGGAIARVPREATAYWHRDVLWNVNVAVTWENPADAEPRTARTKAAWNDIQPLTHGFYANSITGRTSAAMHGTYGGNYERLALIKKKYDPANLLRMNANVIPAA